MYKLSAPNHLLIKGIVCLMLVSLLTGISVVARDDRQSDQLMKLQAQLHSDDFALVAANVQHFSPEHITEIAQFMLNPSLIADSSAFDVSTYDGWNAYNFDRPAGEVIYSVLARRDLFLDPARQLNNPSVTNMSAEGLGALSFSQVYVEETWDKTPNWENDDDMFFNWVHPDLLTIPNPVRYVFGDWLYRERMAYWYVTYTPFLPAVAGHLGYGEGTDYQTVQRNVQAPYFLAPRLSGYSYPIGNQLYTGTTETAYWYADYRQIAAARYGLAAPDVTLDTQITFPDGSGDMLATAENPDFPLWELFNAPFAVDLRLELHHPETASFWNVMRFVHAGARQREGGSQPGLMALRYHERPSQPAGRPIEDVSAFAIMTTVYSDSILLDFTNWNGNADALIFQPEDSTRTDGIHRMLSERNKAIYVIEHLGSEFVYPNATHISGSRGLGLTLTTKYDDPQSGDFLPYTSVEALYLVSALVMEAGAFNIAASQETLCQSSLLRAGYEHAVRTADTAMQSWESVIGELCD